RAHRMRHALDGVGLAVGPVVHRIDAPGVAGALVSGLADAIHDRIAQVDVGRGHVDLGPQRLGAVLALAGPPATEEIEVLLHPAIAIGRRAAGLRQRAAILADLLAAEVVRVRLPAADEL